MFVVTDSRRRPRPVKFDTVVQVVRKRGFGMGKQKSFIRHRYIYIHEYDVQRGFFIDMTPKTHLPTEAIVTIAKTQENLHLPSSAIDYYNRGTRVDLLPIFDRFRQVINKDNNTILLTLGSPWSVIIPMKILWDVDCSAEERQERDKTPQIASRPIRTFVQQNMHSI